LRWEAVVVVFLGFVGGIGFRGLMTDFVFGGVMGSSKRLVARAAINSTGFWTPEGVVPNHDIWSIKKDLELPGSAFMGDSARAQGGQGPPPMLAERFQSVITQLFQQV
jgi:hypothetical protein